MVNKLYGWSLNRRELCLTCGIDINLTWSDILGADDASITRAVGVQCNLKFMSLFPSYSISFTNYSFMSR